MRQVASGAAVCYAAGGSGVETDGIATSEEIAQERRRLI